MNKVNEFFTANPDASVVFEALGNLYANRDDADKVIGGTTATVIIHSAPVPAKEEVPADVTITEAILTENPDLIQHGLKVGDLIQITKEPDLAARESGIVE